MAKTPCVQFISRSVWILSLVSLFTDMASEMLYPVMPVYLQHIGFSVVLIGVLEGIAEAVAGMSKGYFGKWSDRIGKRVPFVVVGYTLSALSKPLLGVLIQPVWVFLVRTMDRLGKGIRSGARDAMLSDEADSRSKARVFGFHRALDTFGAVLGPALAAAYLYFYPQHYKSLFLLAFIPGFIAVMVTLFLRESRFTVKNDTTLFSVSSFAFGYWRLGSADYRKMTSGVLFFMLFNSSDVFVLLRAKEIGLSDAAVIGAYIFYNLIFAVFAFPMGILADKLGRKKVFILGLCCFAFTYAGLTIAHNIWQVFGLLFVYGLFAAATEGVAKAWITNISDARDTGLAVGTFAGLQSICLLIASSVTGLLWFTLGSQTAFLISAVAAILSAWYFLWIPIRE